MVQFACGKILFCIKEGVDATCLSHIKGASVDKIVTDPTWGLAKVAS